MNSIAEMDWELWIRRPDLPIFFTTMWFVAEGPMIRSLICGGFTKQLVIHEGDTEWWIRSKSDFEKAEADIRAYANRRSSNDLAVIFDKAEAVGQSVQHFISQTEQYSDADLLDRFDAIVERSMEIMLYTTSIPAFFLEAVESAKPGELRDEKYILERSQKIRENSYYRSIRTAVLSRLLAAASKRLSLTVQHAEAMTLDELRDALKSGTSSKSADELAKRPYCAYWDMGAGVQISFEESLIAAIKSKVNEPLVQSEVKGAVGYKGTVQGVVRVVHSEFEIEKVKEGDILVAHSTNPALLPAMVRAAAFVTDEGGIGSHAAIMAREMKKPCIIGTRNATDLLKDGDFVVVDAENGVVRKI